MPGAGSLPRIKNCLLLATTLGPRYIGLLGDCKKATMLSAKSGNNPLSKNGASAAAAGLVAATGGFLGVGLAVLAG